MHRALTATLLLGVAACGDDDGADRGDLDPVDMSAPEDGGGEDMPTDP